MPAGLGELQDKGDGRMNQAKQPSRPPLAGSGAGEPSGVRSETAWLAVVLVVGVSVVFTHWPALSAKASSFDDEQYAAVSERGCESFDGEGLLSASGDDFADAGLCGWWSA